LRQMAKESGDDGALEAGEAMCRLSGWPSPRLAAIRENQLQSDKRELEEQLGRNRISMAADEEARARLTKEVTELKAMLDLARAEAAEALRAKEESGKKCEALAAQLTQSQAGNIKLKARLRQEAAARKVTQTNGTQTETVPTENQGVQVSQNQGETQMVSTEPQAADDSATLRQLMEEMRSVQEMLRRSGPLSRTPVETAGAAIGETSTAAGDPTGQGAETAAAPPRSAKVAGRAVLELDTALKSFSEYCPQDGAEGPRYCWIEVGPSEWAQLTQTMREQEFSLRLTGSLRNCGLQPANPQGRASKDGGRRWQLSWYPVMTEGKVQVWPGSVRRVGELRRVEKHPGKLFPVKARVISSWRPRAQPTEGHVANGD
jgi:hypothetical protein